MKNIRQAIEEIYEHESQPFMRLINLLIYSYWLVKMLEIYEPVLAIILSIACTTLVMVVSWWVTKKFMNE